MAGQAFEHTQPLLGQAADAGRRRQLARDPAAHHRIGRGPDVVLGINAPGNARHRQAGQDAKRAGAGQGQTTVEYVRWRRRRPFGPWLHRIVVNRAIDWSRARALRPEAEAVDVPAPRRPEPDDELLAELGRLSPEHRAVIVLRYLLEYTPREIAEMLELPRGTVNSRLRRGLDRLEAIVDREQR